MAASLAAGCGGTDGGDGGSGDDAASGGSDSAILVVGRVLRPDGGRSILLYVEEDLREPRVLDTSTAFEVQGQSRAFPFGGDVFVAEGEAGTIARYAVDEARELVELDRFSMSGVGVTRFRDTFAFVSPTRAYYIDLNNQQVVVWNPTEMTLDATFELPEPPREGLAPAGATPRVVGDRVLMPLSYSNISGDLEAEVSVLALAADRDEVLGVISDPRCALASASFVDDMGDLYVVGDSGDGVLDVFGLTDLPDACLLRLPRDATEFDADFVLPLPALVGAAQVSGLVGRSDRVFLIRTLDPDFDLDSVSDPTAYFQIEAWVWQAVSVDAATATSLGLPPSGISFNPFVVDDAFFVQQLDEETQNTELIRFDGTEASPSVTVTGDVQRVARIR